MTNMIGKISGNDWSKAPEGAKYVDLRNGYFKTPEWRGMYLWVKGELGWWRDFGEYSHGRNYEWGDKSRYISKEQDLGIAAEDSPPLIAAGCYVHKEDIPNEEVFNRIVKAFTDAGFPQLEEYGQWSSKDNPHHQVLLADPSQPPCVMWVRTDCPECEKRLTPEQILGKGYSTETSKEGKRFSSVKEVPVGRFVKGYCDGGGTFSPISYSDTYDGEYVPFVKDIPVTATEKQKKLVELENTLEQLKQQVLELKEME